MTADDVERLVHAELGDQWDRWTPHALDLRRCVVRPPRLEFYLSQMPDGEVTLRLWLVVEECPDTHDGYEVFYDEAQSTFGLAVVDPEGGRCYLGGYGTLWRTLERM
jgi:hypothetical protein